MKFEPEGGSISSQRASFSITEGARMKKKKKYSSISGSKGSIFAIFSLFFSITRQTGRLYEKREYIFETIDDAQPSVYRPYCTWHTLIYLSQYPLRYISCSP